MSLPPVAYIDNRLLDKDCGIGVVLGPAPAGMVPEDFEEDES